MCPPFKTTLSLSNTHLNTFFLAPFLNSMTNAAIQHHVIIQRYLFLNSSDFHSDKLVTTLIKALSFFVVSTKRLAVDSSQLDVIFLPTSVRFKLLSTKIQMTVLL